MDAGTLKILCQIAGIGGLAIGAFLWLLRDLLQKAKLPNLTQKHLTLIISLGFTLGVVGIVAWVWVQPHVSDRNSPGTRVEANCGVAASGEVNVRKITIAGSPCDQGKSHEDRGSNEYSATNSVAAQKVKGEEILIQTHSARGRE